MKEISVLICFRYDLDYYVTDGDYNSTMGHNYPEQRIKYEECQEIVKNESYVIQGKSRQQSHEHYCTNIINIYNRLANVSM